MVFSVANGATPKSGEEDLWDGDIPWITPADLGQNQSAEITIGARSITWKGLNSCGTQIVPTGSILLSIRAPIGHTAIATVPMCFNQGCRGLVPSKTVLTKFGYWSILATKPTLQSEGQGTTFQELGRNKLRAVKIPLPDLPTQRRIAGFLDRETARIDQLIEKKQRLTALLGEKLRSNIHDLFQSLDARIWRIRHLGKVRNGAGFPVDLQGDASNEIPFFKVKHLSVNGLDQRIIESEDTITNETARILRATAFPEGTIVFAKIGAALLLGRFSMLGTEGCIDNNLAVFVVNKRLVDPNYLLLCFERFEMQLMVQPGAVPSLSTEKFINQSVPLPSLEVQRDLVGKVRITTQRNQRIVQRAQDSIDRLREYRSALITAAVTGQIDVMTDVQSGSPDAPPDAIQAERGA